MTEHFLVVGAQRSGTTYLYQVLDEHPGVAMARPVWPEPKFFLDDDKFDRGMDWYEETFFFHAEPGQIRGEKSVGYLESAVAADRIVATLPHARIVAILRDPIERAVSNYRFSVANGLEDRSIEAALGADSPEVERDGGWFVVGDRRIAANPFDYRRRGHYIEDLWRYAASFGRERMHVMVFEDAVGSAGELARLYGFLGVDPGFVPEALATVFNATAGEPSQLAEKLRNELADYYAPLNAALAAEFDLDLSSWEFGR